MNVPPLDPRTGDYAAMLDRATRRRTRRRVTLGAVTAPAVLVALGLGTAGPGAPVTLRPAASLPTLPPLPTLLPGSPSPSPSPTKKPSPSPSPSPSPTDDHPPKSEHPTPPADPADPPDHPPGSPTPSPTYTAYPDRPAYFGYLSNAAPADCETPDALIHSGTELERADAKNWCVRFFGRESYVAGELSKLPVRICRSKAFAVQAGTLTRYGASWLQVRAVASDGSVVWDWSAVSPPSGPSITVQPGDCASWTVVWSASDESGVPLPAGEYRINPVFLVNQYAVPKDAHHFPVTVTG